MQHKITLVAAITFALLAGIAQAEDVYYRVKLTDLELTDGALPPESFGWWRHQDRRVVLLPQAILDGEGEAYIARTDSEMPRFGPLEYAEQSIHIRVPQARQITGTLLLPDEQYSRLLPIRFRIDEDDFDAQMHDAFHRAKLSHYQDLIDGGLPGGAWFRHQQAQARAALGDTAPVDVRPRFGDDDGLLLETYDLFSGGRAVSENLQLDRDMPVTDAAPEATVALDTIRGITVTEMDWQQRLGDAKPELDPLASAIPADQHVLLFPSMDAALGILNMAEQYATPVLQSVAPRSEDIGLRERYERQIGLRISDLAEIARAVGVKGVALTGSDPYIRTGTDVAVILQTEQVDALHDALATRIAANRSGDLPAPAGATRSLLGKLDGAVVITNSQAQMLRLVQVRDGKTPALASLPEFAWFRLRYTLGDADEAAFLMLSDATIRRWCGPKWRIAASRRTRAAAVLYDLEARYADAIITGQVQPGPIDVPFRGIGLGEVRLTEQGVQSSIYGTTGFLTPISELDLTHVTDAEQSAYTRWRDGYERNWSGVFDPIGLRLGLTAEQASADLTVMPLIGGSEYRQLIQLAEGVEIAATAGDPHDEAILHVVMALNINSEAMEGIRMTLTQLVPGLEVNPLGWMGQSLAVYVDADPFWQELAEAGLDNEEFLAANFHRIPIALHAEVSSGLKLVAFLGAVRAMIEQSAPGMTVWTPLQYNGQGYVRITPSLEAQTGEEALQNLAVYYVASSEGLVITYREDLLHRAIDRQIRRRQQRQQQGEAAAPPAWLGKSLAATIDAEGVQLISNASRGPLLQQAQVMSWKNLPILNEWKRRYPDRDPVEVHQALFNTRLVCPGGGQYVWNEQARTMQSTAFGHPADPKEGPAPTDLLGRFLGGDFGITFEDQGLRARAVIRMRPAE